MKANPNIFELIQVLWVHISPRRRKQFLLVLFMMLLTSFAEILTIGAVLPFLQVLTFPEKVFLLDWVQPFISFLNIQSPSELLLPLTIVFITAAILAGMMRLLLLWASTRLTFAAGSDLSISIYRRTLYQPYSVHVSRNSSEIISGISSKVSNVIGMINNILIIISSFVIALLILLALLLINPLIAISAFGGFGFLYFSIIKINSKKVLLDSERIARESTNVVKILQEGLGGVRDVLIDGTQEVYCQVYKKADLTLRKAQGNNVFIAGSPRYAMEALGVALIATLAYMLVKQANGLSNAIPTLGALALGSQRLLPILQQAYGAWSNIKGYQISLQDTIELLNQPLPKFIGDSNSKPIKFERNIQLKDVGFSYLSQNPQILKSINLSIDKGARVGFIGSTGSGKSTLLDIVMGLLIPTNGTLEIDDEVVTSENMRDWQRRIAHVPQSIFLSDGSVEENIAFGIPKDKIDFKRVKDAAEQAQLADTIEAWPEKYKTFVGERGVRLSGGQRQRIGIARALYKRADVIIFDEATSALDVQTEEAVMSSIEGLSEDLTILIAAHRLSTLKKCTQIVEIERGILNRLGSYQELLNGNV